MWHPPSTPPPHLTPVFLPQVGGEEEKRTPRSCHAGFCGSHKPLSPVESHSVILWHVFTIQCLSPIFHHPFSPVTCHSFREMTRHQQRFHLSLKGSIQYCIRAANRPPCDIALRTGYREHVSESWEWHPDLAQGGPRTTLTNPSALSGSVFATFLNTSVKQSLQKGMALSKGTLLLRPPQRR